MARADGTYIENDLPHYQRGGLLGENIKLQKYIFYRTRGALYGTYIRTYMCGRGDVPNRKRSLLKSIWLVGALLVLGLLGNLKTVVLFP